MNDLADLQDELTAHHVRFTPLGLSLPENLAIDAWATVGRRLCRGGKVMQWWLGDWAAFGLRKYEEERKEEAKKKGKANVDPPMTLKDFAKANGIDYGTLRSLAWVSRAVAVSRRRDTLEWSFHQEVAALDPADQVKWLDKIEAEDLPRAELRRQMRQSQGENNALAPDGPVVRFVSKAFDDANRFLRTQPEEFWEDPDLWKIWLERLRPAADRFKWLQEQIKAAK
jgi:hypothetical protein